MNKITISDNDAMSLLKTDDLLTYRYGQDGTKLSSGAKLYVDNSGITIHGNEQACEDLFPLLKEVEDPIPMIIAIRNELTKAFSDGHVRTLMFREVNKLQQAWYVSTDVDLRSITNHVIASSIIINGTKFLHLCTKELLRLLSITTDVTNHNLLDMNTNKVYKRTRAKVKYDTAIAYNRFDDVRKMEYC